ncbi:hypothetical protein N7526_010935 [Penicillium atrosanguineum]|nr:hypothetical protein N7526_010935 [Penicillium atrosanguineum]
MDFIKINDCNAFSEIRYIYSGIFMSSI